MKALQFLSPLIAAVSLSSTLDAQTVKTVEAKGIGLSEKSALKDAARNAVSQVLDTIVESQTIVVDDEVVEDKIIAVAGGFIENFTVIEPAKKNTEGIYSVKIRADIRFDKLSEEITQYSSSETTFNLGTAIREKEEKETAEQTAAMIREEKQKEMAEFLLKMLDDYTKLWNFTATQCVPGDKPNTVLVEIQGSLKKGDYMPKFFTPTRNKLNELGIPIHSRSQYLGYLLSTKNLDAGGYAGYVHYELDLFTANRGTCPNFDKLITSEWYAKNSILKVELKNSENEVLASKNISLSHSRHSPNLLGTYISGGQIWICKFNNAYNNTKKLSTGECKTKRSFTFEVYEPYKIEDIKSVSVKLLRVDAKTPCDEAWDDSLNDRRKR